MSGTSKSRPAATAAELEAAQLRIAELEAALAAAGRRPGVKRLWSKWNAIEMLLKDARTTDDDILAAAAKFSTTYKKPAVFCRAVRAETASWVAAAHSAGWKG